MNKISSSISSLNLSLLSAKISFSVDKARSTETCVTGTANKILKIWLYILVMVLVFKFLKNNFGFGFGFQNFGLMILVLVLVFKIFNGLLVFVVLVLVKKTGFNNKYK